MRRSPFGRAPFWFVVLVAAVCAVVLRTVVPASHASGGAGGDVYHPALAWWTIIVSIVEAIWKGVEVAGRVTLAVLQYSVNLLWGFARNIAQAAGEVAGYVWKGLKDTWELLRGTYENVLKPAWRFFWNWVDRVEQWLSRTFGPLLRYLRRVRDWVLALYANVVRPVLDIIDVTRRGLRVLGALGLEWARALDRRLADLEEAIERPFRLVLEKLNEVIDVIDRVITLDGLVQRRAFIATLARDVKYAVNQLGWGLHNPLSAADRDALAGTLGTAGLAVVAHDLHAYLRAGAGADADALNAAAAEWRRYLGAR